jgi:hypothetical protein
MRRIERQGERLSAQVRAITQIWRSYEYQRSPDRAATRAGKTAQDVFDMAVTLHEVWKLAAHDQQLHQRL